MCSPSGSIFIFNPLPPTPTPPLLPINIHQDHRLPYAYASPLTDPIKTTGSATCSHHRYRLHLLLLQILSR
ncbi:hypothetical protein L2E82_30675 [Cichorium intybus]|uniref:Uncharacterized protein n=1 Tax=Cichorium intybus TaxID=13427 RepID=A0ACB9D120_CICIN|nr:hypothetical protein L2E82_30675 [Cichorium intybus]